MTELEHLQNRADILGATGIKDVISIALLNDGDNALVADNQLRQMNNLIKRAEGPAKGKLKVVITVEKDKDERVIVGVETSVHPPKTELRPMQVGIDASGQLQLPWSETRENFNASITIREAEKIEKQQP
jgi:hypothetical protein